MTNIADVPDGVDWDGSQCSQCGNPLIEGEGIGPEGCLCDECWIPEDDIQCEICGEVQPEDQFLDLEPPVCADCLHAGVD